MADPVETLLELAKARFPDLTDPEAELVRAAASGDVAEPKGEGDDKPIVRAEVVAWLAADPAATKHVHRKGIRLSGVNIEGPLDLEFANITHPLNFTNCEVAQEFNLSHARARAVYMLGTQTGPIMAFGLRVEGDLYLRAGFHAKGEVNVVGANIGGSFDCSGGRFEDPKDKALTADRMYVGESLFLNEGFHAKGEVRLLGANIRGNLEFGGGKFTNPKRIALYADGVSVRGSVFLRNKFDAVGVVRFPGSQIDGDLSCSGGSFKNPRSNALIADRALVRGNVLLQHNFVGEGEVRFLGTEVGGSLLCAGGTFTNPGADALDIEGAKVTGTLGLQGLSQRPAGRVVLRSAAVGVLADDSDSWPEQDKLVLEGFTYNHLAGTAPHSAKERLKWIGLQPQDNFSLQPYEHLAKVLRGMGLEEDARLVAIEKQRELRKRQDSRLARFASWFLDVTVGYGYRPWRPIACLLAVLVFGLVVFAEASMQDALCPTRAANFGGGNCQNFPAEYPEFNALIFAFDVTVPFFDLHQERYWEINPTHPNAWMFRGWQWGNIALGWLFSILAAVGFSGILRKD